MSYLPLSPDLLSPLLLASDEEDDDDDDGGDVESSGPHLTLQYLVLLPS